MAHGRSAHGGGALRWRGRGPRPPAFAAIDLGTNNCRLLIAEPAREGFRVVGGYSQIVRLGEGLAATGRLGEAAMERTMAALTACAERLSFRPVAASRCMATQACRAAANGADFLARVERELGLAFSIIEPEEEARLAVLGCMGLMDPAADAALVVDIGGGSTELSWIEAKASGPAAIRAWASLALGVVTLAERWPEPRHSAGRADWFDAMRRDSAEALCGVFGDDETLARLMGMGKAHIIGTSGTVTSLAGVHLDLARYRRSLIDGVWLAAADCLAASRRLHAMTLAERARHPCIGPARADLVLAGCAILEAVLARWPSDRVRVADRGLREGALMTLIAAHQASRP
ncbi:MAG: Ppx/GppA family phosphatase [Hydrogenophilaceae bacterium]|jgi:exopolyphosphatase/guanosine-5'-triphosphate,3'-diphosphate pyrophosphatase|nr:Ppx/GppA family phosphatase [Hydrogenophilaceae bacterium]